MTSESRLVFVGGVDISASCLEAICESGRLPELVIGYPPSKGDASGYVDLAPLAAQYGFELATPASINDPEVVDRIARIEPHLLYVIGWSELVKRELLEIPQYGCVGIHPTRLPKGRGRAPIPWTILKDLDQTACSMFFLTEGVDDGPIVGQVEVDVSPRETAASLYEKHREAHCALVDRYSASLLAGEINGEEQAHSEATYWPRRAPEDGEIDWTQNATEVDRLVRAVTRPFPGAFCETPSGRLVIWAAEPRFDHSEPAGTAQRDADGWLIGCGEGVLRVLEHDGPIEALAR